MDEFVTSVQDATTALRSLFARTPLQRNAYLSDKFNADIWLKREDLSPVRSYKLRGAFTAMRQVRQLQPDQRVFVCASAGNHAQGVAFACRHFGVEGVIFMPVTTPQQKIDKTRAFGGDAVEIVLKDSQSNPNRAGEVANARCFPYEEPRFLIQHHPDHEISRIELPFRNFLLSPFGFKPGVAFLTSSLCHFLCF